MSYSLFKITLHKQKLNKKNKPSNKSQCNLWIRSFSIIIAFSILASIGGSVRADYFPAAPPPGNVAKETVISLSQTTPSNTVYIDVTEYDTQQVVRSITIKFLEPVTYISFFIDILKDKPFVANAVNTIPIQYYSIRFDSELADKITDITIVFAVEKAVCLNKNVEERTLSQYQYVDSKFEMCPTEKIGEDDTFLYYQTETKTSPYFAIAGPTAFTISWSALVILVVIALATGSYIYRRRKATHSKNPVKA